MRQLLERLDSRNDRYIETDLYWLKKKVENGAEYAVTQLFYDNRKYFVFVEQAKAAGINIPIIP